MRFITAITLILSSISIGMCIDMGVSYYITGVGLHPAAAIGLSIISATLAGVSVFMAYFEPAEDFYQLQWPSVPKK